jgi:hypothetical protein
MGTFSEVAAQTNASEVINIFFHQKVPYPFRTGCGSELSCQRDCGRGNNVSKVRVSELINSKLRG